VEVKTKSGDVVWVCRCGLTTNPDGTCNGNHQKWQTHSEKPGEVYAYDPSGRRRQVAVVDLEDTADDALSACGGGCASCSGCH